uniref:Uncharacterized protein n=1 Tax=Rhizophagus irregularis (strain DAOM 181602 / DAOM 197198 / MUCL 43194) TaxID=747089 RepID=U9U8C7_RHIID
MHKGLKQKLESNRNGPYLGTHFEVVGEENTGHVDYEIKAFERFILSRKGKSHEVGFESDPMRECVAS